MTLAQMATRIVGKLQLTTDPTALPFCKESIKYRYDVIYDAFDWKDARINATLDYPAGIGPFVTEDDMVEHSTQTLPDEIGRVIAVKLRGDDTFLEPIDSTQLVQASGSTFTDLGTPTMYEELTAYVDDPFDPPARYVHRLRLYPAPIGDVSVRIIGKRVRPELEDDTAPIIRGIDQALLAFAESDMLERMRQYGKAEKKVQEGSALLELAKKVEIEQSNRPRRTKALTVSGNSLAELADSVSAKCGTYDFESQILIKHFIRRNYQMAWDCHLWKESIVVASVASDGDNLVLPHYFDRVISLRVDPSLGQLSNVDANYLFQTQPSIFEETSGIQAQWVYMAPVGVAVLPPGGEKLQLVSASNDDLTPVFVRGEWGGKEWTETVTLTGTAPVETEFLYDVPLTIAKRITNGRITVTGYTSTVELQTLNADERERKHIRLWLLPSNAEGTTCLVLGKRKITPLVSDEDTPMLRDIQGVLIESSAADMFMKLEKYDAATDCRNRAAAALKILQDMEAKQGASQQRVVPSVEPYSGYSEIDWIVAK